MKILDIVTFFIILNMCASVLAATGLDISSTQVNPNNSLRPTGNTFQTGQDSMEKINPITGELICNPSDISLACKAEKIHKTYKISNTGVGTFDFLTNAFVGTLASINLFTDLMRDGIFYPGQTISKLLPPDSVLGHSDIEVREAKTKINVFIIIYNILMLIGYILAFIQLIRGVGFKSMS